MRGATYPGAAGEVKLDEHRPEARPSCHQPATTGAMNEPGLIFKALARRTLAR